VYLTQERAEAAIALCTEQGFSAFWLVQGNVWQGWALAEQGQKEAGISQMHQGIAAFRALGAELERYHWFALLAGVYEEMGQAEEGLNALAEALAAANKTGERWWEAALYRLKGQLTLQQFKVQSSRCKVVSLQPLTPNTQHPSGGGSRSVFLEGHRDCPPATSKVAGAASNDKPCSSVATTRQATRSTQHVV
jgi:tetratricopeptide (TPR) repeat protein